MKFKPAHATALLFALPSWTAAFAWLWPRAVQAEALSMEVRVYDWTSLGFAAALGLLGGALALVVSLATDRRVVLLVLRESCRNALVSPISGAVMYVLLKIGTSKGLLMIGVEQRFLFIVGAGWLGIAFFQWLAAIIKRRAAALGKALGGEGKS